jgi:hypothetical protein
MENSFYRQDIKPTVSFHKTPGKIFPLGKTVSILLAWINIPMSGEMNG